MSLLTSSRLRAARRCLRLHRFLYLDGYRPVERPGPRRFGTLVHQALEAWWGAAGEERLDAALAALDAGEADPFERAKAEALLRGYHLRWGDEPYDVLAVEAEFEAPLRNPATGQPSRTYRLGGKVDAIVRDRRDGRVLIVEHKTTSEDASPGSEYWRRLRMDGQVGIYYAGARALGHDVAGCLYDVLRRPGQRPLKANGRRAADETPDEYLARVISAIADAPGDFYARGEVVRLEDEMAEAMHDVWQTAVQIREATITGRHPRNPDACVGFGRTCDFFGVCTGEASLDDWTQFTRTDDVHPELVQITRHPRTKEESSNGTISSSTATSTP